MPEHGFLCDFKNMPGPRVLLLPRVIPRFDNDDVDPHEKQKIGHGVMVPYIFAAMCWVCFFLFLNRVWLRKEANAKQNCIDRHERKGLLDRGAYKAWHPLRNRRWWTRYARAPIANSSTLSSWSAERKTRQIILPAGTTPSGRRLWIWFWTGSANSQTTAQESWFASGFGTKAKQKKLDMHKYIKFSFKTFARTVFLTQAILIPMWAIAKDCRVSVSTMPAVVVPGPAWAAWCWNVSCRTWIFTTASCLCFFGPLKLKHNASCRSFRGLRKEEQDFLHCVVLPPSRNGRCGALQYRTLPEVYLWFVILNCPLWSLWSLF